MDDAPDAEPEAPPYIRLPWPLVAAALGGVLLLALALGLFANRYLRPQLGAAPTSLPLAAAAEPTTGPTPSPAPSPTLAPTPIPTPITVATPTQPP
ncbi:MAG TPA: hypothetical protein VKV73_19820, partial [Chloroflexota bacterium]|nr:hypothetical protein [Chloroflexota bacterium]